MIHLNTNNMQYPSYINLHMILYAYQICFSHHIIIMLYHIQIYSDNMLEAHPHAVSGPATRASKIQRRIFWSYLKCSEVHPNHIQPPSVWSEHYCKKCAAQLEPDKWTKMAFSVLGFRHLCQCLRSSAWLLHSGKSPSECTWNVLARKKKQEGSKALKLLKNIELKVLNKSVCSPSSNEAFCGKVFCQTPVSVWAKPRTATCFYSCSTRIKWSIKKQLSLRQQMNIPKTLDCDLSAHSTCLTPVCPDTKLDSCRPSTVWLLKIHIATMRRKLCNQEHCKITLCVASFMTLLDLKLPQR